MTTKKSNELKYAKNVTLLSAFINFILAIIKIMVGNHTSSRALTTDGVHSLADLFTDAFVYWGASIGNIPPDDNHPYGHQRIETMTMIILSLVLVTTGVIFAYEAINHFYDAPKIMGTYVISVAFISIILNEVIYYYTYKIGQKIHSNLLISNAYHHRSDSLSSLVVLIGAVANIYGYHTLDSLAALIVSIMIIKMGIDLITEGVMELIDTGVDDRTKEKIKRIIKKYPEVIAIQSLRTRLMAGRIFIDMSLKLNKFISVSESAYISKMIETNLKDKLSLIKDVVIHVTSDNDISREEVGNTKISREDLDILLKKQPYYQSIDYFKVYYDFETEIHCILKKSADKTKIKGIKKLADHIKIIFMEDVNHTI